jgi:23S rRNA pseudouridine2605 synthase
MSERLQKLLAQAGYGSRRSCEEFISAGRVRVNGQVATTGQKADPSLDKITLDGKPLPEREQLTYIALYKPRNIISSVEDELGRKTVRDLIPETGHLYPVGRLDWDSEGLILMTNDGDLTNRLTHPRYGHQKEYRVLVAKRPEPEQLATWRRGVVLEDGYKTAPANVYAETGAGKGCWLRLSMGEGRKRQIREIGSLLGLPVVRIVRVAIGSLKVGSLKPGEWRHLTLSEVAELKGKKTTPISIESKSSRKPGNPRKPRSKISQERKRKY